MEEAISTYLKTVNQLCPEAKDDALEFLGSGLTVTVIPRKKFYIQADSIQKNVGFVYKGLLRAYYVDENGNEITIRFSEETDFATDYSSFIKQLPSRYHFQCLESSEIVNIPYTHMQKAFSKFQAFEKYGRLIAEEVLKSQQDRIESFLFQTAEQRYLDFAHQYPTLFNRISLSYLSSYLGIERPSLSRIRKKIARQ